MRRLLRLSRLPGGWLALLIMAIWFVEALQTIAGRWLNVLFGLVPRDLSGIDGIAAMPVLHASPAHAAANTPPLVAMGVLLLLTARRNLVAVNAVIVLGGGLAVWLLAKPGIHVGASGLVFGWFGFLVARGLIDRTWTTLAVTALIVFIYGGLIWGVLPGQPGISWEAHLFGALSGVAAAYIVPARTNTRRPRRR